MTDKPTHSNRWDEGATLVPDGPGRYVTLCACGKPMYWDQERLEARCPAER